MATVVDGFAETDQSARFSGNPTVAVRVFRVGDQSALEVAEKVKAYVEDAQSRLPEGVKLTPWNDYSRILQGRLDLMIKSARNGYILVFIILALFLKFRLAWWVSLGIPISFLGAFWLLPSLDVTINLISLFAFIVVLGIVVDDAIIIGENIFQQNEKGLFGNRGAAIGAKEVATPVIFGVLTTIAAFFPLMFVSGVMGKFMRVIPLIVIATLVFSLIESLLILPAHLSGIPRSKGTHSLGRAWHRLQSGFAERLNWFITSVYQPFLNRALRFRYATIAFAIATLLITGGIVKAGWIKFIFFENVESDFISASLTMPPGTSVETTAEAMKILEQSALQLQTELTEGRADGKSQIKHILTSIGDQPLRNQRSNRMGGATRGASGHLGEIAIELMPTENRTVSSSDIVNRWREMTGSIPDVVELTFESSLFHSGAPIDVQLTGLDMADLVEAANRVKMALTEYTGVYDITDSYRTGKQEIKLSLKPAAESFGVTLADLALQVRQAFYGEEAQRIQRGRDDVRIMIRYPKKQRRSIGDLENMRIRTLGGGEVPFSVVAEAEFGRGYATIQRVDRRRAIDVTAKIDEKKTTAGQVLASLRADVLPAIIPDYPGISYSFEGEQRDQAETMSGLARGFLFALIVIYALMAIPFKSYLQPLIIMSVIPFGFVGAVWGHLLMGRNLTILSMFGLVALAGVVVNDSIVLVHYINQRRLEGVSVMDAVIVAGQARFRAILLTSLTTFAGLSPLLLEKSMQAKFLIPMAISLGYGVIFATFITLMIVPVVYLILEDVKALISNFLGIRPRESVPEP